MSHHLDSPTSRQDPRLNITDLYAFDGDDSTVLTMLGNTSLAGAGRTPRFHPEGRYEFKVHLDGGADTRLTYRVSFGEAAASGAQRVFIDRLVGADACDDEAAGTRVAEGSTGEMICSTDIRVWAGAADPFYVDLHHLAHILEGLQNERPIDNGEWTPQQAASSFTDSHIAAIVLEVPHSDSELHPGRRIGVWATTKLATDAGGWRQINRAGIPMMWPLFRALGSEDDSAEYLRDTVAQPADDSANDTSRVAGFVAAAVRRTGVGDPVAYGGAVAARLLPDVLPYEVGTPAAFTFAGFNGRALADNVAEVMYGLVTNSAVPTGLLAASTAETRQDKFPHVVPA